MRGARRGARREGRQVDAAADHVDLSGRRVPADLLDEAPVELGDRHDEPRVPDLLAEHRAIDVEVVGVRGEAVRRPRERADDPGRERRVRRPVRVDVPDAHALHAARDERGLEHDERRPDEELPRRRVPEERLGPRAGELARPPPEPVELRRDELPREGPVVVRPRPEIAPPRVDVAAAPAEQRQHLDVEPASVQLTDLVQDERLRDRGEPRHEVHDPRSPIRHARPPPHAAAPRRPPHAAAPRRLPGTAPGDAWRR